MILTYSGKSEPTAQKIASQGEKILAWRDSRGDANWGRAKADTKLNPDISNTTNKRVMRNLFARNHVPMPKLVEPTLAFGPWCANKPIVGRPDHHSKGRGFWLIKNNRDMQRALQGTRRKAAATHFMEYIDAPREYRVHVFLGKSIRISEKFYPDRETSRFAWLARKPQHDITHVRQAAKDAVKAVGLDFGAVDILANDTECWVLEVNAAPGLGGTLPALYAKLFEEWSLRE